MSIQDRLWTTGPVVVTSQGAVVNGEPTVRAWATAFRNVVRAKSGVQWATGDLLLYADARGFAAEAVEEAMDATGQQRGTLANLKVIARRFPVERRHRTLSWSHHALVASLPVEQADALLVQAAENNWGWDELRAHAREARQEERREAQTWPTGTFGVLLADPPWSRDDRRLEPMTTKEIAELGDRIRNISTDGSVLYMWAPTDKILSGEVGTILKAWDFRPRATHVWVRALMGDGTWTRPRHELLIVATRGTEAVPPAEDRVPDSVIDGEPREGHYRPDSVYAMLEYCYPAAPRVELFSHFARDGWSAWASELNVQREPVDGRAIHLREEVSA